MIDDRSALAWVAHWPPLSGTGTVGGGGNVATYKQAACLQKLAESRYTLGRIFPWAWSWAWSWAWAQARGFILSACLSSLSCLPLPPSASPAPERCCFFHANNPTILQSSCAVCLSVVSQQAIRPIRAPQAPFSIAWSWHFVTMAACVTLLDGSLRQIPSALRA